MIRSRVNTKKKPAQNVVPLHVGHMDAEFQSLRLHFIAGNHFLTSVSKCYREWTGFQKV